MEKSTILLPKIRLPEMNSEIRTWKENDFKTIRENETKLKIIGETSGVASNLFQENYQRICILLAKGIFSYKEINNRKSVLALSKLLSDENKNELCKKLVFDEQLIQQISLIKSPISKLSLKYFISAFFHKFDDLFSHPDHINLFCGFLKKQLQLSVTDKTKNNVFAIYAQNAELLFNLDAPKKIVEITRDRKQDLGLTLSELKLDSNQDELVIRTQNIYYLEELKIIPVGAPHPILSEFRKEKVINSRYSNERLLGHKIIEIMIDRTVESGNVISSHWQNLILNIAGDPRVPKSNTQYRKWWEILDSRYMQRMINWLSRLDLKIFLGILEQSAKDNGNQDMERMFMPRKIFMEGLLQAGIIRSSRLFLAKEAENYLRKHYDRGQLPSYAKVSNSISIIYLNLNGGVHIVEGTHSFSIKLLDQLPKLAYIDNYDRNNYEYNSLGPRLKYIYANEFKEDNGMIEMTHDCHLKWQYKVISKLREKGINIDTSTVLPANKIREYKEKFGA